MAKVVLVAVIVGADWVDILKAILWLFGSGR